VSSYYITTPIYYVNAEPHLGHAYTTIAADVATRHARQRGMDAFFLTGTDEHGAKIARAAAEAGVEPRDWVAPIADRFRGLTRSVGAQYDFFIRTTDPQHEAFVQRFVTRLRETGDLYEGTYAGFYCTACEAFYRESDLKNGLCPEHGIEVPWVEESNTFFRLSAYADRLLAHYDANPDFVMPRARYNEARSFITGGLEDTSLSRRSTDWGVPLPWAPEQVIYVWIDALLNYASALTYAREGEDLTARLWPAAWQLLGKDILRFHAVLWPAMLMAAGLEPPRRLFIHGMILGHDGNRMSKTRGNTLDPFPVIERYGADALRYYLLREVGFGQDGPVGYGTLQARYESDLANDLGNLVSRTVAMVTRYRDGVIPAVASAPRIAAVMESAASGYAERMDDLDFTGAIERAWELVRELNRFVEERAPWKLARSAEAAEVAALDETLATLVDGVRVLGVILSALLPERARLILAATGESPDAPAYSLAAPGLGTPGARVDGSAGPLFPRVETLAA